MQYAYHDWAVPQMPRDSSRRRLIAPVPGCNPRCVDGACKVVVWSTTPTTLAVCICLLHGLWSVCCGLLWAIHPVHSNLQSPTGVRKDFLCHTPQMSLGVLSRVKSGCKRAVNSHLSSMKYRSIVLLWPLAVAAKAQLALLKRTTRFGSTAQELAKHVLFTSDSYLL